MTIVNYDGLFNHDDLTIMANGLARINSWQMLIMKAPNLTIMVYMVNYNGLILELWLTASYWILLLNGLTRTGFLMI